MWYVLIVGIVNLSVGVGLAVLLQRRLQQGLAHQRALDEAAREMDLEPLTDVAMHEVKLCTKPTSLPVEVKDTSSGFAVPKLKLPQAWRELINESAFNDPVEAAAEMMLHLSCRTYEQLRENDKVIRNFQPNGTETEFESTKSLLIAITDSLAMRSEELKTTFESYGYEFDALSTIAVQLEARVTELTGVLDQQRECLAQVQPSADSSEASETLSRLHYQIVRFTHVWRDMSQATMADIWLTNGRLKELTTTQRIDAASGLENSSGFFETFQRWRQEDAASVRLTSFAMFDINLTNQMNKDLGMEVADNLLARIGRLFGENIRQNRGFDRMFRIGGQCFVAFFGDTNGRNAATASDRLRQKLSSVQFMDQGSPIRVTCNTATLSLEENDSPSIVLDRLALAMDQSKLNGPNWNVLVVDGQTNAFVPQDQEIDETTIDI